MKKYIKGFFLARKHKMPFIIPDHWQGYPTKIKGLRTVKFKEDFTTNETVVNLFYDDIYIYQYLIINFRYLKGSDFIGSNIEFSMLYAGRILKKH